MMEVYCKTPEEEGFKSSHSNDHDNKKRESEFEHKYLQF